MADEAKSGSPTHRAFQVRKYGENNDKSHWTEIGIAWPHEDGQGFNIKLNSLPLDGSITIRPKAEKKAAPDDTPAEDEIPNF